MFKRFSADVTGQLAIVFALAMPVLLATVGFGIDYTAWTRQQAKLHGIADATAVASAREFYMANTDIDQVNAIAASFANAQLIGSDSNSAVGVNAVVRDDNGESAVQVDISQARASFFTGVLGYTFAPLKATAVARVLGGGRLCVIGLDDDASTTISLVQTARVTAPDCAVYSNSDSASSIDAGGSSEIEAELICSAGGVYGSSSHYTPSATTDCPQIEDPLAGRPAPVFGSCDEEDLVINARNGSTTLDPGVYCGGIDIRRGDVHFNPGVYVIKNGAFTITASSRVTGENVGFYLTGTKSVFFFGSESDINFSAPKDGPLAGILFYEDRNAPKLRTHSIRSKRADNLLGTIYLPRGIFEVATNSKVAQDSAYTAVIANRIELSKSPNLHLNADYGATDIPVPDGIGPVGGNVYLEK